jgi:hypothetical protein
MSICSRTCAIFFADTFQIVQPVACHQWLEALLQAGHQRTNGFHIAALLRLVKLYHHAVGFFFQIVRHQIRVAELARLPPETLELVLVLL